ncbi:MAG: acyl-[Blautia sp.]|nr:acyl-[acyl-carrier-protein] thioesterase [Blautia sp.]
MSYSFQSMVRYSEIGADGHLTLPGLLDYFQDCCTFQSAGAGHDIDEIENRHRAWVLNAWQVVIDALPRIGEAVVIRTLPYELKGFWGLRNFILENTKGQRLAWANSIWANINTLTGRPERLTDADTSGYVLDERIEMDYAPRKILLPDSWEALEPFPIQRHLLDTHHHVNNCQYVRMAGDYLEEGTPIQQLRVDYKKQAFLGDIFYPFISRQEDRIYVIFNGSEDISKPDPYTSVEFLIGK